MWKVADSSLLIVNATWAITLTDVLNYNQVKFNHSAFHESYASNVKQGANAGSNQVTRDKIAGYYDTWQHQVVHNRAV